MKSKFIEIYQSLCSDLVSDDDPRRQAIIEEMRIVCTSRKNSEAVDAIEWWGWDTDRTALDFVREARAMYRSLK